MALGLGSMEEARQKRCSDSPSDVGGDREGGNAARSHGLKGMELITTFGT